MGQDKVWESSPKYVLLKEEGWNESQTVRQSPQKVRTFLCAWAQTCIWIQTSERKSWVSASQKSACQLPSFQDLNQVRTESIFFNACILLWRFQLTNPNCVSREVINYPYKDFNSLSVIKTNQGKNKYLHVIIWAQTNKQTWRNTSYNLSI